MFTHLAHSFHCTNCHYERVVMSTVEACTSCPTVNTLQLLHLREIHYRPV